MGGGRGEGGGLNVGLLASAARSPSIVWSLIDEPHRSFNAPKDRKEEKKWEKRQRSETQLNIYTSLTFGVTPLRFLSRRDLVRVEGGGWELFVWEVATEQGEPARAHSSVSEQPASLLFVVPRVRSTCGGGVGEWRVEKRHPGHYESSGSAWASKVWTQQQQSSEPPISPICYLANHHNLHLLSTCHVNCGFARW